MLIIDDILSALLKPFDLIWLIETLRDFALKSKYNIKEITNQIKENRFLFEIDEITKEEYEKSNKQLLKKLKEAKRIMENLSENAMFDEDVNVNIIGT